MEAICRLPYRPWLSCIVTKLQRHDQTIARNCTVVMVAVVRQGYVKIFKSQGGRILIASFYHVTTFYKSSHVVCGYGNDVQDIVPNCFHRIVTTEQIICTHAHNPLSQGPQSRPQCLRGPHAQKRSAVLCAFLLPSESGVKVRYSNRDFSLWIFFINN